MRIGKAYPSSIATDASWLKKRGNYHYGNKKHPVTDQEGLVLGVLTTKASVNETGSLSEELYVADLPEDIALKADKCGNFRILEYMNTHPNTSKHLTYNLTQKQKTYPDYSK